MVSKVKVALFVVVSTVVLYNIFEHLRRLDQIRNQACIQGRPQARSGRVISKYCQLILVTVVIVAMCGSSYLVLLLPCLVTVVTASVIDNIAVTVNEYIMNMTTSEITEKIELHFQLLGLIDSNGRWVHYYFDTNGDIMFPR